MQSKGPLTGADAAANTSMPTTVGSVNHMLMMCLQSRTQSKTSTLQDGWPARPMDLEAEARNDEACNAEVLIRTLSYPISSTLYMSVSKSTHFAAQPHILQSPVHLGKVISLTPQSAHFVCTAFTSELVMSQSFPSIQANMALVLLPQIQSKLS